MGGVATIIGVTYFVAQRHGIPQLDTDIQMDRLHFDQIVMLSDKVYMHGKLISLLSKDLLEELRRRDQVAPEHLKILANISVDEARQLIARDRTALSEKSMRIEKDRLMANRGVIRSRRNAELMQAGLVIIGTAQTSFGSFLFMLR